MRVSQLPPGIPARPEDAGDVSAMPAEQIARSAPLVPYTIQDDAPCLACGYNLRGLGSHGRCPECGTAIGRSLHGNFLRFARPDYVRKLARGVTLILWGLLVALVATVLNVLVAFAGVSPAFLHLIGLLGGLVGLIGAWLATTPDPSRIDEAWQFGARKLIRITVAIGLGNSLLNTVMAAGAGASVTFARAEAAVRVLLLLFLVAQFVGWCAQFVYFRRLALRIPNLKLAGSTRTVMWGTIISLALFLLSTGMVVLLAMAGAGVSGSLVGTANIWLQCGGSVGLVVFSIWWIVLLFAYRWHFLQQAAQAERTWAQGQLLEAPGATMPPAGPAGP